jgi:hypothetical protein
MQHCGKFVKPVLLTAAFLALALFPPAPASAVEWEQIGLAGMEVGQVAVSPMNPDRIFATSLSTMYRSTDGGATFDSVYANPNGYNFSDVEISPVSPDFIVAGDVGNALGTNAHVHYSTNGGTDWNVFNTSYFTIQQIALDPVTASNFYVTTEFGFYKRDDLVEEHGGFAVAVCPTNDQLVVLGAGDTLGIGISTDAGASWQYYSEGIPLHTSTRVNEILFHPADCNEIYVLLQTGTNPATQLGVVSTDGGESYTDIAWDFGSPTASLIDPTVGTSGTLFASSNRGVFRYPIDVGAWDDFSLGLGGIGVNGLANVDGTVLYAGTEDGIWNLEYLPSLAIAARRFDDTAGNGNGKPEEGEQIAVSLFLFNALFQAEGVTATIATANPNVTINDAEATIPAIPALATVANDADPFLVTVNTGAPHAEKVAFDLFLTSNAGAFNDTLTFEMFTARGVILLVDDDAGDAYESYYVAALDTLDMTDSLRNSYDRWDVSLYGSTSAVIQAPYSHDPVIWFTGNAASLTLTSEDRTALTGFLDAGKNLLVTGQDIAADIDTTAFLTSYLGIGLSQDTNPDAILNGVPGDPLGAQLPQILTQGAGGAGNQTSRDELAVTDSNIAFPSIMYDTTAATIGGMRVEKGAARCIFLGFGFEAVNNANNPAFVKRTDMMLAMLTYLRHPTAIGDGPADPAGSLPRVMALEQNYPNPFNPETSISFSVPGNEKEVTAVRLSVYNMRGRLVKMLIDRKVEAGRHTVVWDGRDETGRQVSSGIYLYRLDAGDEVAVRKMVVLK